MTAFGEGEADDLLFVKGITAEQLRLLAEPLEDRERRHLFWLMQEVHGPEKASQIWMAAFSADDAADT